MRSKLLPLALAIFASVVSVASAFAADKPAYKITRVGSGTGWAINESGQVVGWDEAVRSGFLYTPESGIVYIPKPTFAAGTLAYGLNNAGQVTGYAHYAGSGGDRAFLYSAKDGYIEIPAAGTWNRAWDVNDHGVVVGEGYPNTWTFSISSSIAPGPVGFSALGINNSGLMAGLTSNTERAALWSLSGGLVLTGGIGGNTSRFMALNDIGWAAGYGENAYYAEHALLFDGTQMIDIGAQFGATTFSQAYGISESGLVVGRFTPGGSYGNGPLHAFAYSKELGAFDLNDAFAPGQGEGWQLYSAQGATSDGRIVGWGAYNGVMSAFVLTPVPEPNTALLLLLGLPALAFRTQRRHGRQR